MMDPSQEVYFLRAQVKQLEQQLNEAQGRSNIATDLMMAGDSLRHNLMLKAILGGVFTGDVCVPTK